MTTDTIAEEPERASALPYTVWCRQLETALAPLDDCHIECDGMTWTISHLLTTARIPHTCMVGSARHHISAQTVRPHFWIELSNGWLIDFRLRMWLRNDVTIPHGVFSVRDSSAVEYSGQPIQSPLHGQQGRQILSILTDGQISLVTLPSRPVANS